MAGWGVDDSCEPALSENQTVSVTTLLNVFIAFAAALLRMRGLSLRFLGKQIEGFPVVSQKLLQFPNFDPEHPGSTAHHEPTRSVNSGARVSLGDISPQQRECLWPDVACHEPGSE